MIKGGGGIFREGVVDYGRVAHRFLKGGWYILGGRGRSWECRI